MAPRIFKLSVFFYFLLTTVVSAQLTDFSLSLSKVDEICPNNGSITFTVSGATPGSTFLYFIYKLPDETNPLALIDETVYEGLAAGTYKVVAIQSLGVQTNSQTAYITINPVYQPLIFAVTGLIAPCSTVGSITITGLQGAIATYEITSGPVIPPLQTTGVFANLPQGAYSVKVSDACGFAATMDYSLLPPTTSLTIVPAAPSNQSCSTQILSGSFVATGAQSIAAPIQMTCVIHPPSGAPDIVFQQTFTTSTFSFSVPFFPWQTYTYDLTAVNSCGNTAQVIGAVALTDITPKVNGAPLLCSEKLTFSGATAVQLVSAPPNYTGPVPFTVPAGSQNNFTIGNIVEGEYGFQAIDICGGVHDISYISETLVLTPPVIDTYPGCGEEEGGVRILDNTSSGPIVTAFITSAPPTFSGPFPFDVASAIVNGSLYLGDLPKGPYSFHVTTLCGGEFDLSVNVNGVTISNLVYEVQQGCGTFDLFLSATVSAPNFNIFYIQKYNPVSGLWTHPFTNVPQQPGQSLGAVNAYGLNNGGITPNFFVNATYRILNQGLTWQTGVSTLKLCWKPIAEFTVGGFIPSISAFVFGCNDGQSDVLVNFNGIPPYSYRIILKDNLPYIVDNGDSPVFTSLTTGLYTFEATDACGNIYNTTISTVDGFGLPISGITGCENTPGSLSVPYFDFFEYKWWKGNDESNVIGTNSLLAFPSLSTADVGVYHVRVTYLSNSSSCINFVATYNLSDVPRLPKAGVGKSVESCSSVGAIDLFTLLDPPFDNGGTWAALTSGDVLSGSTWTSDSSSSIGNHAFQYTVLNSCGTVNAVANVMLLDAPETPVASALPTACEGSDLQLFSTTVSGAEYVWRGPNGFESSEKDPVIPNVSPDASGTYTLSARTTACESGISEVAVMVTPLPRFSVNGVCEGARFRLSATPESSESGPLSYTWSGPNGYVGDGDSIIAPQKGNYTIVSSDINGCSFARDYEVASIVCEIPQGISPNGDGKNDSFDLSGLDVKKLEILNRYGTVVFDKLHYLNEWHGQDKCGNPLPTATYFYYIELENGTGKAGWVYLTRN